MKKRLKINGVIIFVATLLIIALPKYFFRPDSLDALDEISEIAGFSFVLLGILWRISARGYKAECSKQGIALVKDGPYSAVRNPMYLGIILIGLGVVLTLFSLWALIMFMIVFLARYIPLIFQEEKRLILRFGDEYKHYIQTTPRLFPSIPIILRKDLKEILPLRITWVKKEAGSAVSIILGILVIEFWKDIRGEGLGLYIRECLVFLTLLVIFFILAVSLSAHKTKTILKTR